MDKPPLQPFFGRLEQRLRLVAPHRDLEDVLTGEPEVGALVVAQELIVAGVVGDEELA